MTLKDSISELKGVGDETANNLASLGIRTIGDLIDNVPRRYEDYSNLSSISRLSPGKVTLEAQIGQVRGRYVRRGMHITEAIASDKTGSVRLVWFNQPYREKHLKAGKDYFISGDYGLRRGRFSILNPSIELASDFPVNTARIVPIYKQARSIKSPTLRKLIREALLQNRGLPEHLPEWLISKHGFVSYEQAVHEMHFPSSAKDLQKAKERLAFEEVFELTLAALLNKHELYKDTAIAIRFKQKLAKDFVAKLPFKLTDAQRKTVWRVYQDMSRTQPMNRLIEGDVGSGKTVVAAMAALMALEQGFQAAVMAPTEIVARQHAETLFNLLSNVGYGEQVGLLIGSLSTKQKETVQKRIAKGDIGLMVGTHALIAEKVDMHKLGLIIIDEQHRFGVQQRKKLQAKAGHMPHVLHMTATPIPRSLALTLYGELDISVLDEMPPGRQPIITEICSPNSRKQLYEKVDAQIEHGRQVFVVCPLITESEAVSSLSAEEVYEQLSKKDFKHRKVALLHGRMKPTEKEKTMQNFKDGKYDILVSTTVVEVGVDVPNASIMLIEGVERFGLAQIHQLRGRVGRGQYQSYCYLMMSDSQSPGPRLRALENTNDGFKLAELDLQLRGPGAIYGTVQHGILDLRVAKLTDVKLISAARAAAQMFIDQGEVLKRYPHLEHKVSSLRAITNLN